MRNLLLFLLPVLLFSSRPCHAQVPAIAEISIGMDKETFVKIYPKKDARTYRGDETEEWLTFNQPLQAQSTDVVSFHFENEKLAGWELNNRNEVITEYLGEFCSMAFKQGFPKIYRAIENVLQRIPFADFLKITDRKRPVLFTEFFDSGTAKFANSSEILSLPEDAPAFTDGLTIIKLSTGLESAGNPQAIEGIVAHELAHRVLEHAQKKEQTCELEREANRLIKQWGFSEEYAAASKAFGQKVAGVVTECVGK